LASKFWDLEKEELKLVEEKLKFTPEN